jgi:hypothetical protein
VWLSLTQRFSDSVGEGSLNASQLVPLDAAPHLQMLCSQMVLEAHSHLQVSSIEGPNSIHQNSILMTLSPPKGATSIPSQWRSDINTGILKRYNH